MIETNDSMHGWDLLPRNYYLPQWPRFVRWLVPLVVVASLGIGIALATWPSPLPKPWTGRCVAVLDGDTIWVNNPTGRIKVRLHAADAPELKQPWGVESRAYLKKFIEEKSVGVRPRSRSYDRIVADVYRLREDVGWKMIERGHAWVDTRYSKNETLVQAQATAAKYGRGLWKSRTPEPPWEWRAEH